MKPYDEWTQEESEAPLETMIAEWRAYKKTGLTPAQIETLKAENARLSAERDAAVEDLKNYQNPCGSCIHRAKYSEDYPCRKCQHMDKNRYKANFVSYFEWRGITNPT